MPRENIRYIVSDTSSGDRTKELNFPEAFQKYASRVGDLKLREGEVALNWEDNDWKKPNGAVWLPPASALAHVKERLEGAEHAGMDAFIRGDRGAKGPTYRIRSVEVYDGGEFRYSGEISSRLRNLAEGVWREFGSDNSLSNMGVHVCRRIAGSSQWSQHSWDDAIDLGIGSDMHLGDNINRWLKSHEGSFGGYCELLWRVPNHTNHIHLSLKPCHTGTPPCA